jgi:hypothetical protein
LWLHGMGEGGGDVHGAAVREEEEAALGRCGEEEEGRVGYVDRKAGWASIRGPECPSVELQ